MPNLRGNFDQWQRELERLPGRIDPPPHPAYVLWNYQAEPYLKLPAGVGGMVGLRFCHVLRPLLVDRWRGPGFCCILSPDVLGNSWEALSGALLHELSHHIQHVALLGRVALARHLSAIPPVDDHAALARQWTRDGPPAEPELLQLDSTQSKMHPPSWTRLAIHVAARAGRHPLDVVIAHHLKHPLVEWVEALGDEPQRMRHQRLVEVAFADPPPPFAAMAAAEGSTHGPEPAAQAMQGPGNGRGRRHTGQGKEST